MAERNEPVKITPRMMRRLLLACIGMYAVVVCVIAVYLRMYGDVTPRGMLLAFAPRWMLVVPWFILGAACLVLRGRLVFPLLVAAALTAIGVADYEVRGVRKPLASRAIRLVTYNTDRSPAVAARVRADLVFWDADVAIFQDCAESLADSLRVIAGPSARVLAEFCVVSRLPIESVDSLATASANEPRTKAIRLQVTTSRGAIAVFGVHFDSPRDALWSARHLDFNLLAASIARRTVNSRRVARWVEQSTIPTVVAGDFNLPTSSAILKTDWYRYEDAFAARGSGFGYTMFAGKFAVRIDHVLLSPAFGTDRVVVYRNHPSEHQPLLVDVAWRP